MNELIPVIRRENGVSVFENYDAFRSWLSKGAEEYMIKEYTSVDEALQDMEVLDDIKNRLNEIKADINKPVADVNKQLDELLKIIQKPITRINSIKRENSKAEKTAKILQYAMSSSEPLGAYAGRVIGSESFIEDDWLTTKYSEKKWKDAVDAKISTAVKDINTINNTGGEHKAALLARYYETLSMENTKQYLENLGAGTEGNLQETGDDDNVVGYKVLKIYGTRRQMSQILDELELLGLDYEEVEDGMPRDFEEITEPVMDSFVAFDIETSGTNGAAHNDAPAEITEIGAVKVINGEIVSRFDELCNPGRTITKQVEALTHITNEMVKDKPSVDVVIKLFKDYCGDLPLVGHNIRSMDLHYISAAAKRNGIEFSNKFFDTYLYAKKFKDEKGWENVKLEYLAGQFGIKDESHHRACNDAEVNVDVYFKLRNL